MASGRPYYGRTFVNRYNTQTLMDFISHWKSTYDFAEYYVENWNDDCDIVRYGVYGKAAYIDFCGFVSGAIHMLLHLQATNKVSKGA